MNTPKRMNMTETLAAFSAYYRDHSQRSTGRGLTCIHCGGDIHRVQSSMLLHDEQFGEICAGPGRALRMDIPFCPRCETRPAEYGCIHLPQADLILPSVLEASRPYGVAHPLCGGAEPGASSAKYQTC